MWRTVRRIGRALAWIALVAVLFALIAAATVIVWARSPSGRRILLARAVSIAQTQLAGRLTVGALEGDLTREIALRRVRVYDRERALAITVDTVRIEYDLWGLLSRRLHLRSLAVQGARARVRRLRDGALNLASLQRKPLSQTVGSAAERKRRRGWDTIVDALRVDGEIVVDVPSDRPPLHGRGSVMGALDWRNGAPVFHGLLARLRLDGTLPAPVDATVRLDGPAKDLHAELLVQPATGELRAAVHASMARDVVWHATVESQALDPAALLRGAPHGRIELAARAKGRGRTGVVDVDQLTFETAGTHASLRGLVALDPTLRADLRADASSSELSRLTGVALPALHGRVDAHAHLRATSSRIVVDGSLQGRRLDGKLHLEEQRGRLLARAHVAALGEHPLMAGLRAHGLWMRGEGADLTLDRLAAGEPGRSWHLTRPGRVRVDDRALTVALALAAREQTLSLDAAVDRHHGPLAIDLHGRHLDVRPPARLARIELPHTAVDVDAQLRGTRAAPAGTVQLHGRTLPWPRHALPAIAFDVEAAGDGRRIRGTASASAAGQSLVATLDAPLAPDSDEPLTGELHGSGISLEPLRSLLPPSLRSLSGSAALSAHVSGTTRAPALAADVAARWTLDGFQDRFVAEVTYRDRRLAARWDAPLGASEPGAGLHGTLTLGIDLARARHERFDALLRAAPLSSTVRGRSVDLTKLPLESLGAPPWVHAGLLDVALDVDGTPRTPEARLHAAAHGVALSSAAGVDLTLDAAYAGGRATATLDGAIRGQSLTKLDAHALWNGHTLTATLDGHQTSGGVLHVDASLPAAADAPMHATLTAESLTFAVDDVGSVRRLEGELAADLRVGGTRIAPTVGGFARIEHGAFAGGSDPRLFRDLTLRLEARDHTIELRRLALRVGRGALTAHGHLTLVGIEPAEVEMQAEAERFPFEATNSEAWVNAHLELHGRRVGDRLEGTLTISQGKAHLPALQKSRQLQATGPLEDVVYVDVPSGRQPDASEPAPPRRTQPAIEVLARIPGPFTVDSPELHAQLRGEVEVRTLDGELGVFGHAETTSGRLEILGREYEIEHARASFDGDLDPVIDVRVTRAMGDTKLLISVHGTAAAPQLELASEPPIYDPSQVLGLVMSGDPENRRVRQPPSEQQLAGAVSGLLVNKIKGQLVSGLPIDVINIDPTAGDEVARLSGTRVELGKYLRRTVYVSYVHHFGATMSDVHRTNTHEVHFRYNVRPRMVLGVRYGDAGIGAIDFAWTFRY